MAFELMTRLLEPRDRSSSIDSTPGCGSRNSARTGRSDDGEDDTVDRENSRLVSRQQAFVRVDVRPVVGWGGGSIYGDNGASKRWIPADRGSGRMAAG